jgi:hypothetical protein
MLTIRFSTLAGVMLLAWIGSFLAILLFACLTDRNYARACEISYSQVFILAVLFLCLWLRPA